jgi:hypothetical protein
MTLACTACAASEAYNTDTGAPMLGKPLIKEKNEKNTIFNKTAMLLAALPLGDDSMKAFTQSEFYQTYRETIDKNWIKFAGNRELIARWRDANLSPSYSKAVFYPFSGPDVLHALTFYPQAREIVMFGLEPTGGIPDAGSANPLDQHLWQLLNSLNFSLNKSFFVTKDMGNNITHSSLNGITAVMFFFLSRGGYDVLQAEEINILEDGSIERGAAPKNKGNVNGVEILFTEKGGRDIKRVYYFTIDINDASPQFERFGRHMSKYPPCATIIKSASYLMRWENFSKIRGLALRNSESIIEDDSGIPYKYFKGNSEWKVTHFGKYHRPIGTFEINYQKDLDQDNRAYSVVTIPFVYGYGYGFSDMTYHLLLAVKAKPDKK